jgi:hypothetical protein
MAGFTHREMQPADSPALLALVRDTSDEQGPEKFLPRVEIALAVHGPTPMTPERFICSPGYR